MGLEYVGPFNSGVAAGGAGVATNNQTSDNPIVGLVVGVYLEHLDTPPAATTDVTVETAGNTTPAYDILAIVNAATDGLFLPRMVAHDTAGAAQTPVDQLIPVYDNIKVTIAQANNGDSVNVWLLLAR